MHRRDVSNEKFGRLKPIFVNEELTKKFGRVVWTCLCDCGNYVNVRLYNLISGTSQSCGCLKRELTIKRCRKFNEIITYPELDFGKCFFENSNEYFLFDLRDIDIVKGSCWHKNCHGYAITNIGISNTGGEKFFHRAVMAKHYGQDALKNKVVDHVYHNILDNRIEYMKLCPASRNTRNASRTRGKSGLLNIYKDKNKFVFRISVNYVPYNESFDTEEDAIKYRDNFFKEHNLIDEVYDPNKDIRNTHNPNTDGVICPFYDVNTREDIKRPTIVPFVTTPFTIVDEDKFNNGKF